MGKGKSRLGDFHSPHVQTADNYNLVQGTGKVLTEIYLWWADYIVIGSIRNTSSPATDSLKAIPTARNTSLLLVKIESKSTTDPSRALDDIKSVETTHMDVVTANAGLAQ